MQKKELCAFGREINHRLVDINKPQKWLIEQVRDATGKYFDRSYLNKISTGKMFTPTMVDAICNILNIDHPASHDSTIARE